MAKVDNDTKRRWFQTIGYEPHAGQDEYHYNDARFKVAVCGRRFGKSTMSAKDIEPELFLPKRHYWIIGPTYDLGEKEFRIIWNDIMVKQGLFKDRRIKKSYSLKGGSMFIEFPWQTRLEVRSAQHPESLVGEGLDGAILAEAAKHKRETWERFIRPALADKRGWADFTTTPEGQNWVYTLWQFGQNPEFAEYKSWRFPSWQNDKVYPGGRDDDEIKLLERTTSHEWFLQEIGADFTAFVGKIYSEWDEGHHVKKVEFDPALPNFIGWDWGFVNPLAAIEFQITPDDKVHIWREHYEPYLTLDEHFDKMKQREQPEGYHITMTFGDSADPEATMRVNEKFAPCVSDPDAKTNWRMGVDRVKTFLQDRPPTDFEEDGTPISTPGLFVDYSCTNTIREFGSYRAKPPTGSRPPSDPQDKPVKKADHAMDALRYGLVHLYDLGANYHLEDVAVTESQVVLADATKTRSERGIFTMSDTF
jgi:hypothetical protein